MSNSAEPHAAQERLRQLLEEATPTPGMTMEDGGPHYSNAALVARMKLWSASIKALPALLDIADAARPFVTRGYNMTAPVRPPHWEIEGQHTVWLKRGEWERLAAALAVLDTNKEEEASGSAEAGTSPPVAGAAEKRVSDPDRTNKEDA